MTLYLIDHTSKRIIDVLSAAEVNGRTITLMFENEPIFIKMIHVNTMSRPDIPHIEVDIEMYEVNVK